MCEHKFKEILSDLTIHGSYLHVYECEACGMLDYSVEEVESHIDTGV